MLGKLPVQGRPTYIWIVIGQGPTALAVGAGGGCMDIFSLIYHFSFLSPSLWETARYRLKYCLKGPLSPKQPTNQLEPPAQVGISDKQFIVAVCLYFRVSLDREKIMRFSMKKSVSTRASCIFNERVFQHNILFLFHSVLHKMYNIWQKQRIIHDNIHANDKSVDKFHIVQHKA